MNILYIFLSDQTGRGPDHCASTLATPLPGIIFTVTLCEYLNEFLINRLSVSDISIAATLIVRLKGPSCITYILGKYKT